MQTLKFTAFYPSRPFWAGSKVDFGPPPKVDGWFHSQMTEDVYTTSTDKFCLRVCRDGRISLRISDLEPSNDPEQLATIEATVRRMGEYLDFLNAFYLLLDSAALKVDQTRYFDLHEITHRDVFRVTYENGRLAGENIASESIASIFQMARYPSSYRSDIPIEEDSRIRMRQVVSIDAIKMAATQLTQVVSSPGTERPLASFAKALAEYKISNYSTSIVLAWFITEASLSSLWRTHLESLNRDGDGGSRRINSDRWDVLTGRDFTTSIVSNFLELSEVLSTSEFREVDLVRGYRNKIVHSKAFSPGATEAQLALKTAQQMIQRIWGIGFEANLVHYTTEL